MDAKRVGLIAIGLVVMLNVLACQSMQSGETAAIPSGQKAVLITGGNGGGTVIFLPSGDSNQVMMLSDGKTPMCADCKAAAIKYFQTGELEAKCPTCGAMRQAFTLPPTGIGHN